MYQSGALIFVCGAKIVSGERTFKFKPLQGYGLNIHTFALVKFSKNGYLFSGSKVDKQFSFSKIEFALRQNNRVEEPRIQPLQASEEQKSTHIEESSGITGGLFDMPVQPNGDDPEEEHFRRLMQRKKKRE